MATAAAALAIAATATLGAGMPALAKTHQKVRIEYRYRTPAACSTALTDWRQIEHQQAGVFSNISSYFDGNETADTLIGQVNNMSSAIKAETPGLQAAELECDGS
jgi:hypothetical protein